MAINVIGFVFYGVVVVVVVVTVVFLLVENEIFFVFAVVHYVFIGLRLISGEASFRRPPLRWVLLIVGEILIAILELLAMTRKSFARSPVGAAEIFGSAETVVAP